VVYAVRGIDRVVALTGTDPEEDPLSFKITALPAGGALYQYASGGRGAPIDEPGAVVSDTGGRVVFAPRASECEVLASPDLAQWSSVTNLFNPGGRTSWTDPAAETSSRFYRLKQMP
jgi:hypothetical protein